MAAVDKIEVSASPKILSGTATEIVKRIDNLERDVVPKEIRRTMRIREGDPTLTSLTPTEEFCFAVLALAKRVGIS